jgi:CRISPR-associated protein Cmr1
MTEKNGAFIFTFTAKTDIWTGDADGQPNSLKHTGLLGSIRWWFEVVVRGLGGYACDPSQTECQYKQNDPTKKHCVVCELFGCTGWARKFRFEVLDEHDAHIQKQILKDKLFKLRFTPLRPIQKEEWALLSLTLKLIARYGAIGGKTIHKPYRSDFGLIELKEQHYLKQETAEHLTAEDLNKKLKSYVIAPQWIKNNNEEFWASLNNLKLEKNAWSEKNIKYANRIDEILESLVQRRSST